METKLEPYEVKDDPAPIDGKLKSLRRAFMTGKTKPLAFRVKQLKALKEGLRLMVKDIDAALHADLGRHGYANVLFETGGLEKKINHCLENLGEWTKDESVDTPMLIGPAKSRIVWEPFGVAMIMGSWNFPFFTTIGPLIYAIAAGNCAIIKPSEMSPQSSRVMKRLFVRHLDSSAYACIEGAVQVAIAITSKPFDVICFTGSTEKGKLVAASAAKNLIPCVLELGGKSPTIVDESADIDFAAKKVVWGRYANAGQVCVAPDFVLVHEKVASKFNDLLKKYIKEFWDEGRNVKDGGRAITDWHSKRLCAMLKDHGGEVIQGNANAHEDFNLTSTVVLEPSKESSMMKEEIFGPILPVFKFANIDDAIKRINEGDKPLVLYYFGATFGKNKTRVERETSSGGYVVNDVLVHLLNPDLPFGGVGMSGYGKYHGKAGFQAFSHNKAVLVKPPIPADFLYPPYNSTKQGLIEKAEVLLAGTQRQFFKRFIYFLIALWIIKKIISGKLTPTTVKRFFQTLKVIFTTIRMMMQS